MKKQKSIKSVAKENLTQIGKKLRIVIPENLKNFEGKELSDNEVAKHLSDSLSNPNDNNEKSQNGIIHKNVHTNNHDNYTYHPPQTQIPPSHTNTGHSNHSNSDTYIDHG